MLHETLAAYLLTAMAAFTPMAEHSFCESASVTEARYASIADDIAAVALDEPPVFAGPDGQAETGLLLASIASWESHFAARVDDCRQTGDHGAARSLWQVHAPSARMCRDRKDAARVALAFVRESFAVCRGLPLGERLSFYTGGACDAGRAASRARVGRATRWWSAHPIDVSGEAGPT